MKIHPPTGLPTDTGFQSNAPSLPPSRPELAAVRAKPFNLTRWFSIASFVSISLGAAVTASLLSRFFVEEMLHRDGVVTMEFVQSLTQSQNATSYFLDPATAHDNRTLEAFFERITQMPDVLRANVFARDRSIIWSSNRAIVGKRFDFNPELDKALGGRLIVESGILKGRTYIKPEHVFSTTVSSDFVEDYIPVWNDARTEVIGVVEVYKKPTSLIESLHRGLRLIWLCALIGGIFLFSALFWIVRRGHRLIAAQERQLVSSETFAAVGELAASIVHAIRNPLSSIRSSAELLAESDDRRGVSEASDIMAEVDRVETWLRDLLTYAQTVKGPVSRVDLHKLVQNAAQQFARDLEKQGVTLAFHLDEHRTEVNSEATLIEHVLMTLLANALDAMPAGGTLTVATSRSPDKRTVVLTVTDTGVGIPADQIERIFEPLRSTKKHGLGVGLPLVRRTLERFGGTVTISSAVGSGTIATLSLPAR